MNTALFGLIALVFFTLALVMAALASIYVKRLADRPTLPISEGVGSARIVVRKVRKREQMSQDELEYVSPTSASDSHANIVA